jgi:tRNA nucleotidyltransferase/poly(A) polymerase
LIQTPLEALKTFSDDPLRMLRALRFSLKLKFDLSEEVIAALNNSQLIQRLKIVSRGRFQ